MGCILIPLGSSHGTIPTPLQSVTIISLFLYQLACLFCLINYKICLTIVIMSFTTSCNGWYLSEPFFILFKKPKIWIHCAIFCLFPVLKHHFSSLYPKWGLQKCKYFKCNCIVMWNKNTKSEWLTFFCTSLISPLGLYTPFSSLSNKMRVSFLLHPHTW